MPSNKVGTRKCAVCHLHADKSELIRVVKTSEGFRVDSSGKLEGRGAYVHKNAECIEKAIKKRTLNAAFRTNVPDEVYEELKQYEQ